MYSTLSFARNVARAKYFQPVKVFPSHLSRARHSTPEDYELALPGLHAQVSGVYAASLCLVRKRSASAPEWMGVGLDGRGIIDRHPLGPGTPTSGTSFHKLRCSYILTGFASGPDTVAGLLWAPVLLLIASQEGVCGSSGSVESGANGQSCTADSAWNETLWDASAADCHICLLCHRLPPATCDARLRVRAALTLRKSASHANTTRQPVPKPPRPLFCAFQCQGGGQHCLAQGGGLLRDAYYTHDTSLPGCADALAGYRAATSPHYSCNCSGEHSYLGGEGGLRTGLEFSILSWVAFGLSALLAPLLGAVIDSIESKRIYCMLVGCAGVGMLGSAVLAHNWVWVQLVDRAALVVPQLTTLASWGWLCRDLATLRTQRSTSAAQPPLVPLNTRWVVGMSFAVVGATATELVVIPRQAYLDELSASFSSLKPGELNYLPGQVAGQRLLFSYLSQAHQHAQR